MVITLPALRPAECAALGKHTWGDSKRSLGLRLGSQSHLGYGQLEANAVGGSVDHLHAPPLLHVPPAHLLGDVRLPGDRPTLYVGPADLQHKLTSSSQHSGLTLGLSTAPVVEV